MENNKKFLKVGDKIYIKAKTEGLDYDLENNTVYSINMDRYTDAIHLQKIDPLALPEKIYSTEQDENFIKKVLKCFKNYSGNTLGVMLTGLKGSGKSVEAKLIANRSNLPIIVVDKYIPARVLKNFLTSLEDMKVCLLFDEVDKFSDDYDDDFLLQILDGMNTNGKKLVVFTANEENKINKYLKDRCSRIRYWRKFTELSQSMIEAVLKDRLNNKDEISALHDFISVFLKCVSFDNVAAFVEEVNNNPDTDYTELLNDMNLNRE